MRKLPMLRRLIRSETGATAVEYGLILALVTLACMAALTNMADTVVGMWGDIANKVTGS
jgi:pilus assembly protein Flp/PilA